MDNDTARKIEALRKLLEEFPEATLCVDSEAAPKVIVGNDPGDEIEPDGFHGRSYAAYLADVEQYCQCEEVKTYGMVCVECGKPYNIKTTFTTNGSAGVWGEHE
jgi:hypothetical protein